MVAEAVSTEKGVSEEIIFEAIELALATATKKRYDEDADIEVKIDRSTGDYVTTRRWLVVPTLSSPCWAPSSRPRRLEKRCHLKAWATVHEEIVDNVDFGRIAAQTAKQVIVQRVREAERAQMR